VNHSDEVRAFLVSRRANISPDAAGIISDGDDRRVAGLRREEVAALARMSIDYYKRLERGNLRGVSEAVLEAVADALQLDEAERTHLSNLAKAANQSMRTRARPVNHAHLEITVAELLDQVTVPALVWNGLLDILGGNALGRAMFSWLFDDAPGPLNYARRMFLEPRIRGLWADWEETARSTAGILRMQLGRYPDDPALQRLIADLLSGSEDFRRIWARHDVELHRSGHKTFRHPVVGDIEFTVQSLLVDTAAGPLTIGTFSVQPGSRSEAALSLLTPVRL
jgi:transcriptional regulator with XRE-family HTH domain